MATHMLVRGGIGLVLEVIIDLWSDNHFDANIGKGLGWGLGVRSSFVVERGEGEGMRRGLGMGLGPGLDKGYG